MGGESMRDRDGEKERQTGRKKERVKRCREKLSLFPLHLFTHSQCLSHYLVILVLLKSTLACAQSQSLSLSLSVSLSPSVSHSLSVIYIHNRGGSDM